ncbi:MAG: hypothetical protein DMF62_09285 [Acidobacteria bacterium]|nr:MAG: hypothetical protein DMF62_09285 [Acidobacteriota bacterium]
MHSARRFGWAAVFSLLFVIAVGAAEYRFEDEEPEVKDRVARISFITGDVQIKRSDNDQWEKAVLNLPVVQGDQLTTGPGSRFEVQFGAYSHLRVAENSVIKVSSLTDTFVAVGVPEGSVTATLVRFDIGSEAFEIDAPRTTVAVQKAGRYRVDAGHKNDQSIRVSVDDKGEARIYSNNVGFTLHDGRSAKIYVEGNYAGEWEAGDTTQFRDDFDRWAVDRDLTIARRQGQAYYGKFYDTDIYGADDLNDNGEWINTSDYGYVWRPFRNTLSVYADWSPYRYGAWRWVPGYGWSWVNDEPWGWATYHHGRWIWYNGAWLWAPYGYIRTARSWWYPALVILQQFNRSICWYPLPYHSAYFNFNWNYHHRRQPRDGSVRPGPSPSPRNWPIEPSPRRDGPRDLKGAREPSPNDTAVIAIPMDDFGKVGRGYTRLPGDTARVIVSQKPVTQDELPVLPVMRDISAKVLDDIRVVKPREPMPIDAGTVGAAKRVRDVPLDTTLRDKIILGDRQPVVKNDDDGDDAKQPSDQRSTPPLGAVGRPVKVSEPQRKTVPEPNDETPPQKSEPRDDPPKRAIPVFVPQPKDDSPPQKSVPRSDPPQKSEPRSEPQPKSDPPPQKPEPRSEPPTKSEPPAQKSEPRSEPQTKSEPQRSEPSRDSPAKKP